MKKNIFMTILVCATAASMLFGILYHITGTIRPESRKLKIEQAETKKDSELRLISESSAETKKSEDSAEKKEATSTKEQASEKSEIRILDIDLSLGDLKIVPGDSVNVEYSGNERLRPTVSNEDGTLTITQKSDNRWFNLTPPKSKITVTLPKDTVLRDLEIRENLGDIELHDLKASSGTVYNDLGDIRLDDCDIDGLTIGSSMGDVELDGTLFLQLNVKQDLGDVTIDTPLDLSDAALDLQTDLGDVKVNGTDQGNSHNVTGTGGISVKVTNDLGDVKVKWES
ncbi:MAG: DUF4097 family beta strand repeat protein [Lachnospiraceae bacterium]|nr:DUF4097 family beta strand repeat protein [Lachnospiraceae bacterium]